MLGSEEKAPKEVLPLNDVAVIDVNPGLAIPESARVLFDLYLKNNPKAIVLSTYASGALPDSFTPLIEECKAKEISVFVVSGNYGTDHGIQSIKYEAQLGAVKAGAIPLKDVNVKHLPGVAQAIQSSVNQGLRGKELNQAVVEKFGTPESLIS